MIHRLSRFAINKDDFGLYQIRIENVTASDAGTYRCVVRRSESGGTRTVAEFKSDLVVLGEHYCVMRICYRLFIT